jgi:alpha-1,3-rhamnosyl/mannosyltransferase
VGVNLLWLVPGVVGGSEDYLVRSLLALRAYGPSAVDVTVFGLQSLASAHPDLAEAFPLVTLPLRGRLKPARVLAESTWMAVEARRRHFDVVHHGGGVLPVWAPSRTVVTIHDIQPLVFPETFSTAKRLWLQRMLPRAARRADIVVTTSRFVADTVRDRLGAAEERIRLVPPCPPARRADPEVDGAEVRARLGVGRRYVVYPAITYPHKNHRVLVDALARPEWPADVDLVLTGGSGKAEEDLARQVEQAGLSDRVLRTGRVSRRDLDALLQGAVALVFPSTYEGFGVTVLEGFGEGTPVIASRASALPEVVEGAGLLVDPADPAGWAAAVAVLAGEGPKARAARSLAGRQRAASFTPARTAKALVAAWRAAAGLL